jgi:hypothetical protein
VLLSTVGRRNEGEGGGGSSSRSKKERGPAARVCHGAMEEGASRSR